jgi:hypothetical protein
LQERFVVPDIGGRSCAFGDGLLEFGTRTPLIGAHLTKGCFRDFQAAARGIHLIGRH